MTRTILLFLAAFALTGCNALEQYHYMPLFSEVPSTVKVAFGEKHPTDELKLDQTVAQKMYDGTMRYKFTAVTRKGETHDIVLTESGQEIQ